MRLHLVTVPVLAVVFTLAAPVYFVVQTVLGDQLSAAAMTAALAVGVFVLTTLVTGLPKRTELQDLGRGGALKAAVAGILGIFVSQFLVLAHRYTDAPPGTEVIFFTTACWGVLALVGAMVTRRRPSAAQAVSAAIALFGAAAVLANWERPSSFSPFVRYPVEEVWMLVAGVAWAAFSVLISDLSRRHRLRVFLPLATGSAAAVSLIVALTGPGRAELFSQQADMWMLLFIAASALSAMIVAWSWILAAAGVSSSASLLFLPAVTLTVLGIFERQAGFAGPSPLLWTAVTWGSVAAVAGALGTAFLVGQSRLRSESTAAETALPSRAAPPPSFRASMAFALAPVVLSVLAVVSATVTLWAPALSASVVGTRGTGGRYAASWTMVGAETPAGWIAFFAASLVLVAGVGLLRRAWRPLRAVLAAVCSAIALAAVPALLDTPLRTWTRWIPGEVQQDYGTEYARLTLVRAYGPSTTLTLILAGAASLLLVIAAVTVYRKQRSQAGVSSEGHHQDRADSAQQDGGM